MINLSNEVQQLSNEVNNAINQHQQEDLEQQDTTENPETHAPVWVQDLKPKVNNILKKHTLSGSLTHVQYDINPNQHSLEQYSVTLNNGEPATIFVAYLHENPTTQ